jgi:hypothetical protein
MTLLESPPLTQTPEAVVQLAFEKLQERYPSFKPNPADPSYQYFLAFAYIAVETILLGFDVPEEIIRIVGELVYQTKPAAAVAATATTTWEAVDALGHTIPLGTQVTIEPEGEEPVAFETTEEVTIEAGQTKTAAGAVPIRAIELGEEGNVEGALKVRPSETLSWVEGVTVSTTPSDGVEEETTEEFAARMLELATLVKPQPILPEDFANFVRLLVPGLRGARVLAVDLLELNSKYGHENHTAKAENVERCVTVIPVLENGTEPSEALQKEAYELLESHREATFKPFIGSPTFNKIEIVVEGTVLAGYSKIGTEEQLKAALESFISPANWGLPSTPNQPPGKWVQRKKIFFQDLVTAVNNVPGLGHYTTLTLNGGAADVTMTGIAPLPAKVGAGGGESKVTVSKLNEATE